MNGNIVEILHEIVSLTNESWVELGNRFLLTKSQISGIKNGHVEPQKHVQLLFEKELHRLRLEKQRASMVYEPAPAYRVDEPEKPLGHMMFRGVQIPVFSDDHRTDRFIAAATRLLAANAVSAPPPQNALNAARTVSGVSAPHPRVPGAPAGSQSAASPDPAPAPDPASPANPDHPPEPPPLEP